MKVKDIMIKNVTTLSPNMFVKDAAKRLSELEISGLPVVDENGKLVGMFTEKDILKAILPSYIEKVGKFVYEDDTKGIKKKLETLSNTKIKEIMRKEVVTINEDASCSEAARIVLTQKVRRIPVIDKENRVLGIVARCDILRVLMEEN